MTNAAEPAGSKGPFTPLQQESLNLHKKVRDNLFVDREYPLAISNARKIKDKGIQVLAFTDILYSLGVAAYSARSSIEAIVVTRMLLEASRMIKDSNIPESDRTRLLREAKEIRGHMLISVSDEVALNDTGVIGSDYAAVGKSILLRDGGKWGEAKALVDRSSIRNTAARVGVYCSLASYFPEKETDVGGGVSIVPHYNPVEMFKTAIGWAADAKETPEFYRDEISRLIMASRLNEDNKAALIKLLNEKVS